MRRSILSLSAVFMSLLICISSVYAESASMTLADLREQTPSRWTQTYKTKWRTVEIDAPIYLPTADAVPALQIAYDQRPIALTAEESGWFSVRAHNDMTLMLSNYTGEVIIPQELGGRRVSDTPTAAGAWYSGFSESSQYVPMSTITFGELQSQIKNELLQFGFDPSDYQLERPTCLWAQHWYYKGTAEDAVSGHVLMEIRQRIAGIPLLNSVYTAAVPNSGKAEQAGEVPVDFGLSVGYDGALGKLSYMNLKAAKLDQVLAEDLPLVSFDAVRQNIEKEVTDGRLRKVYEVEFGYLIYNQPKAERAANPDHLAELVRYELLPVWQVNCLYVSSAKSALKSAKGEDGRNSTDYCQLFFDAQTGERIGPSKAQDRCEYKGFISWSEVK